MTSSRRSRAGLLATLAGIVATALTIASCEPVRTGAAAIVGSSSIAVETVQEQVTQVLDAADKETSTQLTGKEADLQRQVLTRLIDGMILEAAARQLSVTVTDGEVDRQEGGLLQQAGGETQLQQQALQSGIAPRHLRSVIRQLTLNEKLASATVANVTVSRAQLAAEYKKNIAQFDRVHAAHILVRTQPLAAEILKEVKADPGEEEFAKLAAKHSIDTNSKDTGGDLGTNGQAQFDPAFGKAIFAAKPGSFLMVKTQFGYHVVHILSHDITTLAEATSQLRSSILKSESDKRLSALLDSVMRGLHIKVNPRYGYWNGSDRAVAPPRDSDRLSKPEPTPTPTPTGAPIVPGQVPPGG